MPCGIESSPTGRRVGFATRCLLAALSLAAAAPAGSHEQAGPDAQPQVQVLAPGWGRLAFSAPEPGTYQLPPLGYAADGAVVDARGQPRSLHDVFAGRIVLLAFANLLTLFLKKGSTVPNRYGAAPTAFSFAR